MVRVTAPGKPDRTGFCNTVCHYEERTNGTTVTSFVMHNDTDGRHQISQEACSTLLHRGTQHRSCGAAFPFETGQTFSSKDNKPCPPSVCEPPGRENKAPPAFATLHQQARQHSPPEESAYVMRNGPNTRKNKEHKLPGICVPVPQRG